MRAYIIMFKDLKKNDIILVAAVLILAAGVWICSELLKTEGAVAVVTVNGEKTAEYPLYEDAEIRLENGEGYNILVIKNGTADIVEASCPDRVCVDQRAISKTGEAITCLPNKTVITVEGAEESADVDLVS